MLGQVTPFWSTLHELDKLHSETTLYKIHVPLSHRVIPGGGGYETHGIREQLRSEGQTPSPHHMLNVVSKD